MAEIDGIKVISSDGQEFTLRSDLVPHFEAIVKLNEERFDKPGSSGPIPLDVMGSVLATVFDWYERRENMPPMDEEMPLPTAFDKELLFPTNDHRRLALILNATSALGCEILKRITSKIFAVYLKGKTEEQLFEIFGLQNMLVIDQVLQSKREELREKDKEKEAKKKREKEAKREKDRKKKK